MKLLVVEDEDRIAAFMVKGLRAQGHVVERAVTGGEALTLAQRCDGSEASAGGYDVVLLDLGLPDLDGLEVLATLRRRGVGTPVVVVTARQEDTDRECARRLGAEDYLVKPFVFHDLVASVEQAARMDGAPAA